jgi:hypothetical protein
MNKNKNAAFLSARSQARSNKNKLTKSPSTTSYLHLTDCIPMRSKEPRIPCGVLLLLLAD